MPFVLDGVLDLVTRIGQVVPGFDEDQNLLYAPSAEWTMKRIEVDQRFETCVRDLYVIGDCAGTTQGVLAAAVTGVLAAPSIAARCSV